MSPTLAGPTVNSVWQRTDVIKLAADTRHMNFPTTTSAQFAPTSRRAKGMSIAGKRNTHPVQRSGPVQGTGRQYGVFGSPGVLGTLGFAGLAFAGWLALILVTADSFRLAEDAPEGQHHRRITLFNEEVRAAAATLDQDRKQCQTLKAQPRRACQKEARRNGQIALRAARQRYEVSSTQRQIAQP